jgi:hypothetical protein
VTPVSLQHILLFEFDDVFQFTFDDIHR